MKKSRVRKNIRKKTSRKFNKSKRRTNRPKKSNNKRKRKTKKLTKRRKSNIIKGGSLKKTKKKNSAITKKKNSAIREHIDILFKELYKYPEEIKKLINNINDNIKDDVLNSKKDKDFIQNLIVWFNKLKSFLKYTNININDEISVLESNIDKINEEIKNESINFLQTKYKNGLLSKGLIAIEWLISQNGNFRNMGIWLYNPDGQGTIDGTHYINKRAPFTTHEYLNHYKNHKYNKILNELKSSEELKYKKKIYNFIKILQQIVDDFNDQDIIKNKKDKIKILENKKKELKLLKSYLQYFNKIKDEYPTEFDSLIRLLEIKNNETFLDELRSDIHIKF